MEDVKEVKHDAELEFMECVYICDNGTPEEVKPDDEELLFEEVDYVDIRDEETDDDDSVKNVIVLSSPQKVTEFMNELTNPAPPSTQRISKCTCHEEVIKLRKEVEYLKKFIKRKDQQMQDQIAEQLSQTTREIQEIASSSIKLLFDQKNLDTVTNTPECDASVKLLSFPMTTDREIVELNERLSTNNAEKRLLFLTLRKLGGDTLRHYIKRVMKYLLDDSVAYLYTWGGLGNNKCFKDHIYLYQLLIDVVTGYSENVTLTQMENEMKTFFHSAHDRRNKSEYRKEKMRK